ncbi:MAG: hypothetical protein IJ711_03345 [Lachnospiraceae bacterium]|nr:hypothetical protein [Lachnospiraceae bacterium]
MDIRGLFAFSREEQMDFLRRMIGTDGIEGAVLVSTCNRTEVYFSGRRESAGRVEKLFAEVKQADIHLLRRYFRTYQGQQALQHLFYVISGLDSMVIGEDEILGQMRGAYKLSCELECADYYINAIFQKALSCAKQIKTDTCLSKTSVSVATLCAGEIARFKEGQKKVLLLGATGQIGGILLKDLISTKDVHVYATVRRHHPLSFAKQSGENDGAHGLRAAMTEIPYERRYEYMDQADVIVSATKSPHYTITYDACKEALLHTKERLFIDLAIPSDIDPDIAQFGNVTYKNIDYFEALAREHNEQKLEAVGQAEQIIAEECDETGKELLFHDFVPHMEDVERKLGDKNARQLLFAMKEAANKEELEAILTVLHKMLRE